jgi:hypothetical protein
MTGTLMLCWWKYKMVQSLWKTAWQFFAKINMHSPYDPEFHLGIFPKELEITQKSINTNSE